MRTFGRVLAGLGVGLAVIGSAGAIAMLPPPVLQEAGNYVEERRQALRQHLPEMPDLQGLVAGDAEPDCAPATFDSGAQDAPDCAAAEDPPGDPATLLMRSNDASRRFRAPAPATATTLQ